MKHLPFSVRRTITNNDKALDLIQEELNIQRKRQPELDKIVLNKMVANLSRCNEDDLWCKISKSPKHYNTVSRYGLDWYGWSRIIDYFKGLLLHNYIEAIPGYHNKTGGKSFMTKMKGTDKLWTLLTEDVCIKMDDMKGEVIFMKDRNGRFVDYADTKFTDAMRAMLKKYNTFVEEVSLEVSPLEVSLEPGSLDCLHGTCKDSSIYNNLSLLRVFNRSNWKCGGRFYGPDYQELPSEVRSTILIDGEPTIELDYSGLHIRMLYHVIGIDYTGECYVFNKQDTKNKTAREVIKVMSLCAINAPTHRKAVGACRDKCEEAYTDGELELPDDRTGLYSGAYNSFIEGHPLIARFIGKDKGIELMNKDSFIMEQILIRLMDMNIVGLPIHDSVIVQAKHEDTLRQVMSEEYEKVMKFKPIIDKKG